MNILICDDMPDEAKALDDLLRSSGFLINTNIFCHTLDVLNFIHRGATVDLCFLDILMPEMTGIELARNLRQSGYTGSIVFLSTSKEYGPESYTVGAFSYLLKPPTADSVGDILNRIIKARNSVDLAGIVVKLAGVVKVILHRNISHAEVIRHTVYIRLTDGSEAYVNTTFSEIAVQLLSDPRFVQCHRSYVVNMQDVAEI